MHTETKEPLDLLSLAGDSSLVEGFSAPESDWNGRWRWGLGPECRIIPDSPRQLLYRCALPKAGMKVEIQLGDKQNRLLVSQWDWQEFSGSILLQPGQTLSFLSSAWNDTQNPIFPVDPRPMAILFRALKLMDPSPRPPVQPSLKGKICPFPFGRMEGVAPQFAPCCRFWLKEELFFEETDGTDHWNGPAARKLRQSILAGTYEFCDLAICRAPVNTVEELAEGKGAVPVPAANLTALQAGKTEMPEGPSSLVITSDPRCNLACASCRVEKVTTLTPLEELAVAETDRMLARHASSLRHLKFATDGEVFFSPFLRKKLKETSRELYPQLESVEILSNGTLFDERAMEELKPGTDFIRKVEISLDAGDAATYGKVRGGDWERLQKNLRWLSSLRASGRLDLLALSFTVRKENFRSLPEFFTLAQELNVDKIYVLRLLPWSRMRIQFENEAICEPTHPEHAALAAVAGDVLGKNWGFRVEENLGIS